MNMDKYLEECLDVYESGVVELVKNNYKKQERCNDIESRIVLMISPKCFTRR